MKKHKSSEIIKITIAAVLTIGLFSLAFLTVNNLVFAEATDKVASVPSVLATVNNAGVAETNLPTAGLVPSFPTAEIAPVEDGSQSESSDSEVYIEPELEVYQEHNEWFTPGKDALSPEEAARIGAKYIWDMFGKSIDGKTVRMYYTSSPSQTRPYWWGYVGDSKENLDVNGEIFYFLFDFMICAISGERIDISQVLEIDFSGATRERSMAIRAVLSELSAEEKDELQRLLDTHEPPERLADYQKMAEDYAARHFTFSEVTSSRVNESFSFDAFGLDENGKIIIIPARVLRFTVTDSTGREAEVAINVKTEELDSIISQHSDIVPGYSIDDPNAVG